MEKIRYNPKPRPFSAAVSPAELLKSWRRFLIYIPLCLFFLSCDQHAIFFDISREVKPKDPYIPGSPTKIVQGGTEDLYVSNGKGIYRNQGSGWAPMDKPSGSITDLAAAGNSLYCIVENRRLYEYTGGGWKEIPGLGGYTYLQNIYGTGSNLYICASSAGSGANVYTILSLNGGTPHSTGISGAGEGFLLRGAAANYIATTGGIYNGNNTTPISGSTGHTIMGLIELPEGGGIAASTKDGYILHGSGTLKAVSLGLSFDRAMATYKTKNGYLLLVGVHTKGFVEIELNNGSLPSYAQYHHPGQGTYGETTTAHDYAQYRSSLGIQSLTALYQQGQSGSLFASTQQKGLWAYQNGDEGWQWNAY